MLLKTTNSLAKTSLKASQLHRPSRRRSPPRPPPSSVSSLSPSPDSTTITNIILDTDPQTLSCTLHSLTEWTPDLVHTILKRLWNHGPKALEFFTILDRHLTYPHSATAFDYAIDVAARMHDYKTMWTLVSRMRQRKLGPSPKTFAIITERLIVRRCPSSMYIRMSNCRWQSIYRSFSHFPFMPPFSRGESLEVKLLSYNLDCKISSYIIFFLS